MLLLQSAQGLDCFNIAGEFLFGASDAQIIIRDVKISGGFWHRFSVQGFIGGSSMGGLMSLYALLQYNDVFSRAAALSPSIWVSPEKLDGLVGRAKLEPGTVLYMDYGSREMGNHDGMRKGFAEMCSKIMIRGIHLTSRLVPGGTHSEASWEKQLPFVIHTLMYELD